MLDTFDTSKTCLKFAPLSNSTQSQSNDESNYNLPLHKFNLDSFCQYREDKLNLDLDFEDDVEYDSGSESGEDQYSENDQES